MQPRKISAAFGFGVVLGLWFLGTVATVAGEGKADTRLLLEDPSFSRGFRVLDPKPGKRVEVGRLVGPAGEGAEPAWDLPQWSSRHDIGGVEPERLASGAVRYRNAGKKIVIGPSGSEQGDLTFAVYGSAEYDGPKGREDPWPHLYASQRIESELSLAGMERLRVRFEARLLRSEMVQSEASYDRRIHAAQYLMFLTVQNMNRASEGYGEYVWFGVPIYDNRQRFHSGHVAIDADREKKKGTGKLIYTVAQKRIAEGSLHGGEWVTFDADVLPMMKEAVRTAWERGALPGERRLGDYRIGGIVIGWEMPGVFDAAVRLRGLAVEAEPVEPDE